MAESKFSELVRYFDPLSAGDARSPRKAPETTAPKTVGESQYIGTETCPKCHEKQYQKLKDTKMGMAIVFNPRQPKLSVMNQESYLLTTSAEIGGLRKFDEAARVEDTAQALRQFDPTDKLSFSASYDTTQDKYRQTPYGLLDKDTI